MQGVSRTRRQRGYGSAIAIVMAIVCLLVAPLSVDEAKQRVESTTSSHASHRSLVREPQAIYVSDPHDAWNQVFFLLFTRAISARVMAPDSPVFFSGDPNLRVGDERITRIESGDRAIDPLYPSWLWMNSLAFDFDREAAWNVLREPRYSRLIASIEGVRLTARSRPPLARALMQADLWAAFDMMYALTRPRPGHSTDDVRERIQYAQLLLPRLAMTMRGLALTRDEIAALPNTYFAAATALGLPDVLEDGTWREVRWWPERSHDRAANDRRATRVFLRLRAPAPDEAAVLNGLRARHGDAPPVIDSTARLTQLLLVASDGTVMPSSITYEVQLRGDAARRDASHVPQYELSRRELLSAPANGGLIAFDADTPAYLPSAGNDLGFATPPRLDGEPVQAPLQTRCAGCHGSSPGVGRVVTFSLPTFPDTPTPPVERLVPAQNVHAHDVARRKMAREDYRALRARW